MGISFNLRGQQEWLFKQSVLGGDEHIALNYHEWKERFSSPGQNFEGYRVQTFCGKDLKFNSNYSRMRRHAGMLRSACEACFIQYERPAAAIRRESKETDDLPF